MNESLLAEKVDHLNKQKGLDESVNSHIKDWILRSDLPSRIRINPFHICNDKFSINDIIPSLLHGVKVGLFNLHWDVHCPYCNRCQPWRAKRRLVDPRRRAPLAAYPSCASARGDAA
jgi:hypothetical protein